MVDEEFFTPPEIFIAMNGKAYLRKYPQGGELLRALPSLQLNPELLQIAPNYVGGAIQARPTHQ